jgi:16S rRNA C1402 N4-methylase RsmH
MANNKLQELKDALQDRNCSLEKHSSVMEITFENSEDADWFENIFEDYQKESVVCCLMSMRPKGENARHKFVFNLKDMDKFIDLIKKE